MDALQAQVGANALDDMGAIVASFTLPDKYPVVRQKNPYSNVKTATANPFKEYPNNWSAPNTAGLSYMAGFQFRDALRHTIQFDSNPASATYTYNWSLGDGTTAIPIGAGQQHAFLPIYASAGSVYAPHEQYLFSGIDLNGNTYIYVDGDATNNGTITVTPTTASCAATLYAWDGSQGQEVQTHATTTGAIPFSLAVPGYYRVEVQSTDVAGTFTVSSSYNGNNVWAHHTLPGYVDNIYNVSGLRITSFATLQRNTGAAEYVNGRVALVQFGNTQNPLQVLAGGPEAMFSFISGVREAETRDFKNGFYGFGRVADVKDLDFQQPLTSATINQWSGSFPLLPRSGYLAYSALVTSSAGQPAAVTQYRISCGVEYTTNNLWAEVRLPTATKQTWEAAAQAVANIQQWHENPQHVGDILCQVADLSSVGIPLIQRTLRLIPSANAKAVADKLGIVLDLANAARSACAVASMGRKRPGVW